MPESTRVPRPDLVMWPEEASAEETVAVRRGEIAEDAGLTTWKRYSLAVPLSEMPPSKPPKVIAFSELAGAAGLRVKRKVPLPSVRLEPAAPVTA